MTKVSDILDTGLLREMIEGGFISARSHPRYPYLIYNYTLKATFENEWNEATLTCRGLIVNGETGEVIARPFRKFFNHRQPGCPKIEPDTRVIVADKMDGSLGILYPEPDGGYAIATRGSFESAQAIRGTEMWKERYEGRTRLGELKGTTLLFEIIYPENRIVLDYGYDELVFLASVDIDGGHTNHIDAVFWPGKVAETFPYRTFAEALAAPPRPNAEGLVLYLPETNERIKIKQDDYLAMHKIVCGLNERAVWEAIAAGNADAFIAGLPDEFQEWATGVRKRIEGGIVDEIAACLREFAKLEMSLPKEYSRKDFAIRAAESANKWAMFALLDGRDIEPEIIKRARPEANLFPSNLRCQIEDAA